MRYIFQAFLVLLLVIEPIAGYAQTPDAQSGPSISGVSSPSTSPIPQTTENTPAQPTTAASLPSTSQTQQALDNSPPAPAPPVNTTKVKRKRHHLSGVNLGIIIATGVLLVIVLGPLGGGK